MSDMFSGKDSYIAMADAKTAQFLAATEIFTQISGGMQADQAAGAANIGFGSGVDLGGFGR